MIKSSTNIHSLSYLVVLTLIAMSLPLSKFTMSVFEFLLVALWLWAGFSFSISVRFFKMGGFFKGTAHFFSYVGTLAYENVTEKIVAFSKNRPALILTSIYFMHVIGLFYTSDIDYALKDLRIKLPLLLFPIILSTMEKIEYRRFRIMMIFYVLATLAGTLISFSLMMKANFTDIREVSPFISPIRFGLNITFSLFTLVYFIIFDKKFRFWQKILFGIVIAWFVAILILLESLTSLWIVLFIMVLYSVILLFRTQNLIVKLSFVMLAVGIPLVVILYVKHIVHETRTPPHIVAAELDTHTASGNTYVHDTINLGVEDGRYLGLYLCEKEMAEAWNKRSSYKYNGRTRGGEEMKATLIRYLTSKNLRKDAEGVNALTDWDVKMIEKGVANYRYVKNPGLRTRILKIMIGYDVYKKTGDPSGSSVMQRIEYSKAAIKLIHENFWTGVGTGDIENKLISEYIQMGSELKKEFMFHAHNQFLAIFVTFGVFGFLFFIFALIYPAVKAGGFKDYFFVTFFIIIIISMFSDDTLETQAGATLFAFFYTFLLFGKKRQNST